MKLLFALLITFAPIDWSTNNYYANFEVGKFYKHPYNQIIYVREKIVTLKGKELLVIEQISGRTCAYPHNVCDVEPKALTMAWTELKRIN